ncbi:MAG: hypothetical protein KIH08_05085 [Candidatus Freyarchaeota archaeon]|nr:hypothetical protein [Candidatus Jordarchaeia archaeon]MBS7269268.1 hypothetical protein [Candidatus Jordarchaeia archaeon]
MCGSNSKKSIYIIRKMSVPHCARGPLRCEKCRIMEKEKKICLLKVYLEPGEIARPVLDIYFDGEKKFCEYDLIKTFENEEAAKEYAKRNMLNLLD